MATENILVPALERALNIIEYLSKKDEPVSLKQIASALNIPLASAFRLMKNLAAREYVKEMNSGQLQYVLGLKITELAYRANRNLSLNITAKPYMEILSEKTGQTSQLAVLNNNDVIYTEQFFPTTPVSIVAPLHTPVPLTLSAAGKMMLSKLSRPEQQKIISSLNFIQKTSRSIITRDALEDELKTLSTQGYALDNEEYAIGIGCLAAPICDQNNRCIAAIGITGHINDYNNSEKFAGLVSSIRAAANAISKACGCQISI